MMAAATAYGGTVTGTLQGPSGLPVKNATLTFTLQQAGLIAGSGSVVPTTASCYTSTDGSVVGITQPTYASQYFDYVWLGHDGGGHLLRNVHVLRQRGQPNPALPGMQVQLTGTGSLIISPPATFPANAAGITVYAGAVSGAETAQGNTAGPTEPFDQERRR